MIAKQEYNDRLDRAVFDFLGMEPGVLVDLSEFLVRLGQDPEGIASLCPHPGEAEANRLAGLVKGLEVLAFTGRGFTARVRPIFGRPLAETACDGCLKCVEVCPTGAIFAKLGIPEPAES